MLVVRQAERVPELVHHRREVETAARFVAECLIDDKSATSQRRDTLRVGEILPRRVVSGCVLVARSRTSSCSRGRVECFRAANERRVLHHFDFSTRAVCGRYLPEWVECEVVQRVVPRQYGLVDERLKRCIARADRGAYAINDVLIQVDGFAAGVAISVAGSDRLASDGDVGMFVGSQLRVVSDSSDRCPAWRAQAQRRCAESCAYDGCQNDGAHPHASLARRLAERLGELVELLVERML